MKEFDIEYQYAKYIEVENIDLAKMTLQEREENKKTFVSAFTMAFFLFSKTLTSIKDEDKAIGLLNSFKVDLEIYWKNNKN